MLDVYEGAVFNKVAMEINSFPLKIIVVQELAVAAVMQLKRYVATVLATV